MNARVATAIIACGIILLAWLSAPDIRPLGARAVTAESVSIFPGAINGLAMPDSGGMAQLQELAANKPVPGTPAPVMHQLHFKVPDGEGYGLYLPAAPPETALWINGMMGGDSLPARYLGPGFGPYLASLDIPQDMLGFDQNRIDLVVEAGWDRARPPLIMLIPARTGPAFGVMMAQAETRLRWGAIILGGLGWIASLGGLALLRSRLAFAGGLLFSLALFDFAFGMMPANVRLACATVALAILFMRSERSNRALMGCLIAAIVGLILALLLYGGSAQSLTHIWITNIVFWPLAGLALPMLALGEARSVWAEFIAARAKIREQAALIALQQDQLEATIRAQAVGEERQRFVRDMHDGVGGQLLSLLMRVRADDANRDEVVEELEKGLTDLRMMTDSLDHVGDNLDEALLAFERRAAQQLASTGLSFDWSKPDSLNRFAMDARAVLNLYRIIQEALSNCIRHAEASRFAVRFDLASDSSRLDVMIEDDGVGFVPDPAREGRGLSNIRKRAQKLGAGIAFGPAHGGKGTLISLSIPAAGE